MSRFAQRRRRHDSLSLAIVFALGALVLSSGVAFAQEPATPAADAFPPFAELPALPDATPRADGPLKIVATTPIVADLVRQVGGGRVEVESILPNNADPHDFEPAPEDVVKVEDADAVFIHGLHLDEWSEALIDNADSDVPVFVTTRDVETLAAEEHEDEAEEGEGHDHESEDGDPHVWFDPTRVKIMVANIAADLGTLDPDGASSYGDRAAAYQANLDVLDAAIAERIALIPEANRKLVTNHDALHYFADRYGLTIVGTVIPGTDTRAEPSAQDVAELIEAIEREGIKAIFAENTVSPTLAQELAAQAGIAIVDDLYTDSLGDADSGADTYIGLMQTDTKLIVEALR